MNVITSSLTFVVISLVILRLKFYKYFALFVGVLTTGRGLVAVYLFYKLLKVRLSRKFFLILPIVLFSVDSLRNGGSSKEVFSHKA